MKLHELNAPEIPEAEKGNLTIDAVIALFTEKQPSKTEIAKLANQYNTSVDGMNGIIYSLLHSFLAKFGKHNTVPDDKFDADELKKGIEVEHEHTDDSNISQLIAKDHLAELPDYYTRLEKMENEK